MSYAEEMDQRQDASSPSPPSLPPTDGSYQTPVTESVTRLAPVPGDVQLPSPTSSEEAIPIPPPRATSPDREVSGQRCWTRRKFDKTPGAGASGRLFWRSSGLEGRIALDPILLDAERLVAALETGVFELTNTRVHQNLLLHYIGRSMAQSAILLRELCNMAGRAYHPADLLEISWRDLQWVEIQRRVSPSQHKGLRCERRL